MPRSARSRMAIVMETPLAFGLMPWEAVATFSGTAATLIAGAAAVFAAYRVGMQQARISKLQADILDQQARTDESRFQAELFERRMKVYLTLRDTIDAAATQDRPVKLDVMTKMFDRLDEARFIFDPKIYDFGEKAVNLISNILGGYDIIEEAKNGNDERSAPNAHVMIYKTKAELTALRDSMHKLFLDEMHVSHFAPIRRPHL